MHPLVEQQLKRNYVVHRLYYFKIEDRANYMMSGPSHKLSSGGAGDYPGGSWFKSWPYWGGQGLKSNATGRVMV